MTDREQQIAVGVVIAWLLWSSEVEAADESPTAEKLLEQWEPDRPIELYDTPQGLVVMESGEGSEGVWYWPVPTMSAEGDLFPAVVSSGFGEARSADGGGTRLHQGQDIMYSRGKLGPVREAGDHGSKNFFAPVGTPVLAARAGRVWSTGHGQHGWQVILDHGKGSGFSTSYLHLDQLLIPEHKNGRQLDGSPAVDVEAGQNIGIMGWSPVDSAQIRHLHFEVRKNKPGGGLEKVNPVSLGQKSWGRVVWNR